MTDQKINYKPLDAMDGAWSAVLKDMPASHYAPVILGLVLAVAAAVVIHHPGPVVLAAALIGQHLSGKVKKYKNNIWQNFGTANNWRVGIATMPEATVEGLIPPSLLGRGHSEELSPFVEAKPGNHTFEVFMYKFSTGSGKSEKDHYCTIAHVSLEKPFPHLILDSKSNKTLLERGDATQRVKLEGDFDSYFTLFIQKGRQIDALSVITPDVMQTLIDMNSHQEIEVSDKHLFFISNNDLRNSASVKALFEAANALTDEIVHKARTIKI